MSYHVLFNNERQGPMAREDILRGYSAGTIPRLSLVWAEGMLDWQQLGQVFDLTQVPPPHPKPPPPPPSGPHSPPCPFPQSNGALYPKWPLIATGICLILWCLMASWAASLENDARPYLNEAHRMGTGEYAAGTFLESLYRGANGDPLGTFYDQYRKEDYIKDRLVW